MKICLISNDLIESNARLQPFPYLLGLANDLASAGHNISFISTISENANEASFFFGYPIYRVKRINSYYITPSSELISAIKSLSPDVILWHLGLTSFLHAFDIPKLQMPVVGLFTSPIYQLAGLIKINTNAIWQGYKTIFPHLLGTLIPSSLIKKVFKSNSINRLIVESNTTKTSLVQRGVPEEYISRVYPEISSSWFQTISPIERIKKRSSLGFLEKDIIVVFFGPPPLLRGLPYLIRAVAKAREINFSLHLLILSRNRPGEFKRETNDLQRIIREVNGNEWIRIIKGFLKPNELIETVSACDIVALPFELVPSDMPLSILEAMALGIPVISTTVFSIPEIIPANCGICVKPGSIDELANAISFLTGDSELRSKIGKAGKEHIVNWMNTRYEFENWNIYLDELIENHSY